MQRRSFVVDEGLDKLQELLLAMAAGDEISVPRAVEISGLQAAHCEAVLDALTRIGLMDQLDDGSYARRHLPD